MTIRRKLRALLYVLSLAGKRNNSFTFSRNLIDSFFVPVVGARSVFPTKSV